MRDLDYAVTDFSGVALRYGGFYGDPDDALVAAVRKRRYPIVGDGGGYTSRIHVEDAAAAAVAALECAGPEIYNVVDDEPAPVHEWLPVLAEALGAKQPRHVPLCIVRPFLGQAAIAMGESRGASNAKIKRPLEWTPRYPSWRQGFAHLHGASATTSEPDPSAPPGASKLAT